MTFPSVFHELAVILALAAAAGAAALALRQPLIIAFIVVGVLVGPAGFGWVRATDQVETLAKIGIAVLLFVVALKLDIGLIKTVGPVAVYTGLGQIVFTSGIGFLIARLLGMAPLAAAYVAVALTFSSTIIIVKLLSDKREIDSLHGRIAVGFLIVQDVFAILALLVLPSLGGSTGSAAASGLARLAIVGTALVAGMYLLTRWGMPWLLERIARSQVLLVLFAVTWAVALAALSDVLGLSKEVGAFLGGVSIASTPFRDAIASRLTSLRDFLLLFFFIELGSRLQIGDIAGLAAPAVLLSLFVLVGNPLIVIAIMGFMGYRRRTGLLAGLTVAQISEFSLILAALGVQLGHIDARTLSLVTLVGVVTIGLSTYLITYSAHVYELVKRPLRVFERKAAFREIEDQAASPARVDAVVLGVGRYGGRIVKRLIRRGTSVLGVDFDPKALAASRAYGAATQYGDATDPELAASLPLSTARVVVSTLPQLDANAAIVHGLRAAGYSGPFIATAHDDADADALQNSLGACRVLLPYSDAADEATDIIESVIRDTSPLRTCSVGNPG